MWVSLSLPAVDGRTRADFPLQLSSCQVQSFIIKLRVFSLLTSLRIFSKCDQSKYLRKMLPMLGFWIQELTFARQTLLPLKLSPKSKGNFNKKTLSIPAYTLHSSVDTLTFSACSLWSCVLLYDLLSVSLCIILWKYASQKVNGTPKQDRRMLLICRLGEYVTVI